MVMPMSRMELKKQQKKSTRFISFVFMLIFIILIAGLMATDYAMREMLALFDGSRLLGYGRVEELHEIYLMGDIYYINQTEAKEQVTQWATSIKAWINSGYRWIKDKLPY